MGKGLQIWSDTNTVFNIHRFYDDEIFIYFFD